MYLPLLILARLSAMMSRRMIFAAAVIGVAQMTAMTWAGGGVASGFELQILWFVPIMVCLLNVRQVAVVVGLAVAGTVFVQWLTHQPFSAGDRFAGPAALLLATVLINTFEVAYVFRQLRELSELFRAQSRSDALTGLGNRAELAACAEEQTTGAPGAGYVIDIDGFKLINDAAGHHAGDQLLERLASRLRAHARTGDLLARSGGDEFVLIARGIADAPAAMRLAERLLETSAEPFALDDITTHVSVTVGVAMLDDAGTVNEGLRNADLALYAAKAVRRGTARMFQATMRAQALDRLAVETQLRAAMDRGELRLVYQPIVAIYDGRVGGVEALMRWRSQELGDVTPGQFIPVAERAGLIAELGRFALSEAVQRLAAWRAQGHDRLNMGVNISALQLADKDLPGFIGSLLAEHHVPPERLVLELTETGLMEHATSRPLEMLDRLSMVGVQLSLDDFGTGYSSLARLSRLRLDSAKIDRSFVAAMLNDPATDAIVTLVVRMAELMGMRVIAEGVETCEQLEHLVALGCPLVQGFLLSQPLEAAEAAWYLDAHRAGTCLTASGCGFVAEADGAVADVHETRSVSCTIAGSR
jgi:diguanylate cyclase (GGDEF)-like protein